MCEKCILSATRTVTGRDPPREEVKARVKERTTAFQTVRSVWQLTRSGPLKQLFLALCTPFTGLWVWKAERRDPRSRRGGGESEADKKWGGLSRLLRSISRRNWYFLWARQTSCSLNSSVMSITTCTSELIVINQAEWSLVRCELIKESFEPVEDILGLRRVFLNWVIFGNYLSNLDFQVKSN